MLYFGISKDGQTGIVNSKDKTINILGTKEETDEYVKKNSLPVIAHEDMQTVLNFVSSYCVNKGDLAGEQWEQTVACARASDKSMLKGIGGSHRDYAEGIIEDYERFKALCDDIDFDICKSDDMLIKDLIDLFGVHRRQCVDYKLKKEQCAESIREFKDDWWLQDLDYWMYE
jgi:hypothetical protein